MTSSPQDTISVEAVSDGTNSVFDRFTTFMLKNSITSPSEASFESGDDGSFESLRQLTALGSIFRVFVNGRARLTGRVEMRDSTDDPSRSSNIRFVIRTKLTDAVVASCDPKVRTKNASIKEFVLACYATIGVGEDQFIFDPKTSRDLLTGKSSRGARAPRDLAPIKDDQAKVRPPETVFQAVDRHLKRHGFMHWDSPDGKIIVGAPDDTQDPIYRFVQRRTTGSFSNNVISCQEAQDVGQAPTIMSVLGTGGGGGIAKSKISATEANETMVDGEFQRPLLIVDEGIKTKERANRRVRREMAQRTRGLQNLNVICDGLSYRSDGGLVPYAPDTVAELNIERLGGSLGAFYCESVEMTQSPGMADRTILRVVPEGIWVL